MSTARDMHAWYRALFEEPERIGLTPGAAAGPALHYMGHILDLVMRRLVAGYPACWLTLYWHHGSPHAARRIGARHALPALPLHTAAACCHPCPYPLAKLQTMLRTSLHCTR